MSDMSTLECLIGMIWEKEKELDLLMNKTSKIASEINILRVVRREIKEALDANERGEADE